MRKVLFAALAAVFLIVGVAVALAVKNVDPESVTKQSETNTDEIEWTQPNTESLAYYGLDEFDTELPVVYIDTGGEALSKDYKVRCGFSILGADADGSTHNIMDTPEVMLYADVNYRGASSEHFEKRQYRICFYKDADGVSKKEYDFLGMGEASEWVLNGPFLDKTLARNRIVYQLGNEIMDWAPETRYIELFVDGEYKGVYLAVEAVTNDESRLNLATYGLLSGETAYIVERNRDDSDENPLENYGRINGYTSFSLYIDYPGATKITDDERTYIESDISEFERSLYSARFDDEEGGYADYIDVDAFVDYFIINEVAMNHDGGGLSTYYYKDIEGKLSITLWDYNNCWDNYQWFSEDFDEFYLTEMPWFERLVEDDAFVDKVVERYRQLRQGELSTEHVLELLSQTREELEAATDRNFAVWGYTFESNLLAGSGRDITSYDEAYRQLKKAIKKRFKFLDEHIEDLYEL